MRRAVGLEEEGKFVVAIAIVNVVVDVIWRSEGARSARVVVARMRKSAARGDHYVHEAAPENLRILEGQGEGGGPLEPRAGAALISALTFRL